MQLTFCLLHLLRRWYISDVYDRPLSERLRVLDVNLFMTSLNAEVDAAESGSDSLYYLGAQKYFPVLACACACHAFACMLVSEIAPPPAAADVCSR